MIKDNKYRFSLLVFSLFAVANVQGQFVDYLCEVGVQGGMGYYVGDATEHIFNNIQPVYGLQFRYKFTPRWALSAKAQGQRIKINDPHYDNGVFEKYITNQLWSADIVAEFNFFRFGTKQYDNRVKQITPYIFLGIGGSIGYGGSMGKKWHGGGLYIPCGIGLKWKFAKHWGLNFAWQQQIYFTDDLENKKRMDDPKGLNGSNILNNDFTSNLILGIVFEFATLPPPCKLCK